MAGMKKEYLGSIERVSSWFVYLLPWIVASSFFTKKHFLVACGAVALGRNLVLKRREFFWVDWSVFLSLTAWLAVAAIRVHFFGVPLSDSSDGLHAYDFKRSFFIAIAYFVCADTVVREFGLPRAFRLFAMTLGLSIALFTGFLLVTEPKQIFALYGPEWRLTYWLGWGFDDICAILGVWFFVMVALKRNEPWDWALYCFGLFLFLSLGRRPTIFYAALLLMSFWKGISIQALKGSVRKQSVWIGALLGGLMLAIFYFGTAVVTFLKGTPVVQRLLWTTQGGWAEEGRFALVQTFMKQYDFSEFFGAHINAAKIAGGLESFHNLILDGFWYGGWIGGLFVIFGLTILVVRALKSRSYIGLVMMLFIILGLLVAAPPFSNQFAFALVLPLFLEYLRHVRSTKPVHL